MSCILPDKGDIWQHFPLIVLDFQRNRPTIKPSQFGVIFERGENEEGQPNTTTDVYRWLYDSRRTSAIVALHKRT